jgi:hypothetical protein
MDLILIHKLKKMKIGCSIDVIVIILLGYARILTKTTLINVLTSSNIMFLKLENAGKVRQKEI